MAEAPSPGQGEDNYVCNHLIAMQTVLSDPGLEWSALDFSTEDRGIYRTFKVEFPSDDIVAEFKDMFAEGKLVDNFVTIKWNCTSFLAGKDLAEQSEILETVGDQDPNDYYYGQGADGGD